jgi:hypothetical protein
VVKQPVSPTFTDPLFLHSDSYLENEVTCIHDSVAGFRRNVNPI